MSDLTALLEPKSIAVIGASAVPGKVGHEVLANLIEGGYAGEIVAVNSKGGKILGRPSYKDCVSSGKRIDLAVIAIPNTFVMRAVDDALAAGAKAICVITAGYREVGAEGLKLETELLSRCQRGGARLLGPNCLGLINAPLKMNASFAKHLPEPGGISVISQSGALCTAMLDWASARGLGLAKLISMGNKADLDETVLIETFAADEQTRVIAGYLESIGDGDAFVETAQAASAIKPIVLFKSGVTSSGGKAASSHTGSLAGADVAYGSAFARAGVIRADTFEALFDYAMAFEMQPLPKGDRVAIITNAGGPGIMAADAVELSHMTVAQLADAAASALRSKLPAAASVGNPIDVLGDADPERYALALEAALADDSVDAVVVILTPQAMTLPVETAQAIATRAKGGKPIVVSFMGGMDVAAGRDALLKANLPDYPSPERAVAALKAMVDYAAWRRRPPRVLARFPVNGRRVGRIIRRHLKTGRLQVNEAHAKSVLRAYGFNVPPGNTAATAAEAIDLADKIGYPVAMKIDSPDIIHKSDLGGVKLNLASADAVRDAYDLMMLRITQKMPEADIAGVYLERMCAKGREVILGMTRDAQFGPMLMFGLGGIFVEVMKDVAFNLAPITEEEALLMLRGTRSYALLEGARGEKRVDLKAIANALQRISQLVTDFPQISEMDINPFIVGPVGTDAIAADARITLTASA